MATPFSNPDLWQIVTFTFTLPSTPTVTDARGNTSSLGEVVAITFKIAPLGGDRSIGGAQQSEAANTAAPVYKCRVTAVNGDTGNPILPVGISPGDIGEGVLNGHTVKAIVKEIAQSSLQPVLEPILGSSVKLAINYRIRRGSSI